MKHLLYISLVVLYLCSACENSDREFSDYKYTTVYFPYQTPVRTLVLGEDIYDNSLDNEHKCKIMATMGGVYANNSERILDVTVDNSLADNLLFESDSSEVLAMPAEYYSLENKMQIIIPSGSIVGGIEVQLTDAFFADSRSVENTFVIPLRIESVSGADSVLRGKSTLSDPNPFVATDWNAVPKDFILYCVKYINPWNGAYLRRGVDVGIGSSGNSDLDTTAVYHEEYVERDQVVKMSTLSLNENSLTLSTRNRGNDNDIPFEIRLAFDASGNCEVSAPADSSYTANGNGVFVKDGDMWGNEERDVLYLDYEVDFGTSLHSITDTLVLRDRAVAMETFIPVVTD